MHSMKQSKRQALAQQIFYEIVLFGQLVAEGYDSSTLKKIFLKKQGEDFSALITKKVLHTWRRILRHKKQKTAFVEKQRFEEGAQQRDFEVLYIEKFYKLLSGTENLSNTTRAWVKESWNCFSTFFPCLVP